MDDHQLQLLSNKAGVFLSSLGIKHSPELIDCLVSLSASIEPVTGTNETDENHSISADKKKPHDLADHFADYFLVHLANKDQLSSLHQHGDVNRRIQLYNHGMILGMENHHHIFKQLRDLKLLSFDSKRCLKIDSTMLSIITSSEVDQSHSLKHLIFHVISNSSPWCPDQKTAENGTPFQKGNIFYVRKSIISDVHFETNQKILSVPSDIFLDTHPITLIAMAKDNFIFVVDSTSKRVKQYAHSVARVAPISLVILINDNDIDLESELNEAIESGLVNPSHFIVQARQVIEQKKRSVYPSLKQNVLSALESNVTNTDDLPCRIEELLHVKKKIKEIDEPPLSHIAETSTTQPTKHLIYPELISCTDPAELYRVIDLLKYRSEPNAGKNVILISGPPGSGKTAFAQLLGYPQISRFRIGESRNDSYYAGIERRALEEYKACKPDTLFQVDEPEVMVANREGLTDDSRGHHHLSLVNTFLTILDPCTPGTSIILTSNHPECIDPAVRSRLSCHLKFVEPDLSKLKLAFMIYWKQASGQYITSNEIDFIIEKALTPLVGRITLRDFAISANIYSQTHVDNLSHNPFDYLRKILSKFDMGEN